MSTVVRRSEVAPQPWTNGGGTTRELLRADDGSWRVSLADIDKDGPFSAFPGRRRLLTVVDGIVLTLVVDGVEQLVEPRRPFAFEGGAEVSASVPEGPVRALNVIVDPAVVAPHVTVLQGDARAGQEEAGPHDLVVGPADVSGRCTLAVITLQRP